MDIDFGFWSILIGPATVVLLAFLCVLSYVSGIRETQRRFRLSLRGMFVMMAVVATSLAAIMSANSWFLLVVVIGLLLAWADLVTDGRLLRA